MKKIGLYIHIPFCVKKCRYCAFYSLDDCDAATKYRYIQALCMEIRFMLSRFPECIVDSIFIGGGTPSSLPAEMIEWVLETIKGCAMVTEDAEITMEANPGTLTPAKIDTYKRVGINRISMGVQSFSEDILKAYGRIHSAEDVYRNYKDLRDAGFNNINLDLMFGLPGQTMEDWQNSLNEAIKLNPEHISFYSLQLEEGTPLFEDFKRGIFDEVPEEEDRAEYHEAIRRFTSAGYNHYEISNAAKPGFECRHNLKYWSSEPYLGFGPGASSFMDGWRFTNDADLEKYMKYWGDVAETMPEVPEFFLIPEGKLFNGRFTDNLLSECHENSLKDSISEYTFTALRRSQGLDINHFHDTFGLDFFEHFAEIKPVIDGYIETGHIILEENTIRLTDTGFDISNSIMSEFV